MLPFHSWVLLTLQGTIEIGGQLSTVRSVAEPDIGIIHVPCADGDGTYPLHFAWQSVTGLRFCREGYCRQKEARLYLGEKTDHATHREA